IEFLEPLGFVHWRNDAMDRLPFGNGQPCLNQPRSPTNDDKGEKRGNHHIKPDAHPATVFGSTWGNGRSMGQTRHCAHDLSIRPGHLPVERAWEPRCAGSTSASKGIRIDADALACRRSNLSRL